MHRKQVINFIILLCTLTILLSGGWILLILHGYHTGEKAYEDILTCMNPQPASTQTDVSNGSDQVPTDDSFPSVDFNALRQINPEIVAWLFIPGTSINYPVLQGSDNSYYLNHLADGTRNRCGSIFLDYRSSPDFSDRNTIIHGHNMGNGTMFQDLTLYKSHEFFDDHPNGYLLTPKEKYTITFFAGSLVTVDSDAWKRDFSGDAAFNTWLDDILSAASVHTELQPNSSDQIVSLSTCSYEFQDARWVLQGFITAK